MDAFRNDSEALETILDAYALEIRKTANNRRNLGKRPILCLLDGLNEAGFIRIGPEHKMCDAP